MKMRDMNFRVCIDEGSVPTTYGVASRSGERASRLSTDFGEVDKLVRACNRNRLSMEHFWDVVEDFRRS